MSAKRLYEGFRGRKVDRTTAIGIRFGSRWVTAPGTLNILIPASLAVIGNITAIEYDTTRDGKMVPARHEFKSGARPLLVAGSGEGQVFLIGEGYKFTTRGFVDL